MTSLKPKEEIREFDIPMSLGDHIEEFRKRVLYILLGTITTFCNGSKGRKCVCMYKVPDEGAVLVQ